MRIEELDATDTPIGVISLRRRDEPVVGHDVYEVRIDDEFLMSSLNELSGSLFSLRRGVTRQSWSG